MQPKNLPRSDVASGGLGGALSVLLMLSLGSEEFDYEAVSAAIAVVLTFLGGYIPSNYKPFWAAVAAPLAALIATFLSVFIFDAPVGQTIVSTAVSSIVVALFTYIVPPLDS